MRKDFTPPDRTAEHALLLIAAAAAMTLLISIAVTYSQLYHV